MYPDTISCNYILTQYMNTVYHSIHTHTCMMHSQSCNKTYTQLPGHNPDIKQEQEAQCCTTCGTATYHAS